MTFVASLFTDGIKMNKNRNFLIPLKKKFFNIMFQYYVFTSVFYEVSTWARIGLEKEKFKTLQDHFK